MKSDNKQVPQLIVLGILVVLCIGYVSFKVMGSGTAKKAENKPADATAETKSAAVTVTEDVIAESVFPGLNTLPDRRDPFTPQALPGQRFDRNGGAPMSKPASVSMPVTKFPKIDIKPFNPFGGAPANNVSARPPGAVGTEPQFTLTGVVRGVQNVAILRTPDGGRYVVKQGQLINGRYRVIVVTDDAVVLGYGSRRMYVKLGGEQNAS